MLKEEFSKKIKNLSEEIQIELTEKQIDQFFIYMNLLLEWNEKINLTAIVEPNEIILKHLIDSITISKYIEQNAKIVDVGTGAGFPGIPLKIIRNDVEITLLDSLNKRINFLNEVIDKLELTNIDAVHGRAEEFARNKNYREKFDYATSRAVANLSTLSEYLVPLVKLNGRCICMKGPDIKEELKDSKNALNLLGAEVQEVDGFELPNSNISRNVVIIKKIKSTSNKYPRKAGTPSKNPL